ncbi:N-acetylglucosamine-binding protein GbpA [Burkholderia stagnalis]|uniref:N-acetylglucosamine-binding protein GbpA n=1 Tax=Burkholderia stagnalis TaxID=1503054 RepID=UPI00075A287B|nr:N-acetylglucosamine-binding protein GbpA [Burkholderia stagnalis]KVL84258.1 acetylglucosamine-binding protein [Burkholderia stagnalis]KVL98481.1 acetylglucosamine-binding protein [Burkholderia stagnalis]KVM16772.1 acetylglucosamine-binding protein [Burkholderia stagnalis]KVM83785.1 acetylglucosamine-binding protein [Burkholderia stagnalis]KVM92251.1 acetylglucosamine-binding protein [Burkholderia stagnalis]
MRTRTAKKTLLTLSPLVACASMFFAQAAFAHGYLSEPPSRNLLCSSKSGKIENFNCGSVTYEPQSIEGKQGFPAAGAPDGEIASGGVTQFSELNEQAVDRWKINDIKPGAQKFKWTFTAPHVTKDFKYYLTKQGWNPNAKLTRDQFDLTPFCTIDGGMKKADEIGPHNCTIPSDKKGHHVMLTTWHVGDTAGMFYNVADLNITDDGGATDPGKPSWSNVGSIAPTMDLKAGDKVMNRVFKSGGEVPSMKTTVTIGSAQQGERNMWPMLLAKEINRTQAANLIAGVERDGRIEPSLGKNDVFSKSSSGIVRTETTIEHKPEGGIDEGFSISNNGEFKIQNGKATAKFFLKFNHAKDTNVTVKVYDASNSMVGSKSSTMRMQGDVNVDIANAKAGNHTAVATSQIDGGKLMQETATFKLTGEAGGGEGAQCQAQWKQGTAYTGGAKVQHDGRTYEARWWTQNEVPGNPASTGADHTGKVWKDLGACSK